MFAWIRQVVAWLVILGVVAVLAVAVVVPRLAGATPYTVLTGSMRPTYPPGTLVVVKPVDVADLRAGDVITYQRESGEAAVVTHRVVSVGSRLNGDLVLTTQGDANGVADPPVRPIQVRGRLWYAIPYLGYVNSALSGRQREVAVLAVSGALIGYAAFMFAGALRDRRRSARGAHRSTTTTSTVS
ncbi:signal peptidase I [Nocardioides nitrophenolicus]|uniref:signal peptidase I n=1 Tax=Nocardioides nitrophenolicus TaxID=60489 RepID=UPI0027DB4FB5|nr:signal peptidase I [Nocardioides nitrophenolicus]MBM7520167.1 signal peptidase [Nocardioides nitrophenolicus]